MSEHDVEVRRNPSGGWDVTGGVHSYHDTVVQAEAWAKTVLARNGGGRILLYSERSDPPREVQVASRREAERG